jgi:hypothetical protein
MVYTVIESRKPHTHSKEKHMEERAKFFEVEIEGKNAKEAFLKAVDEARNKHGDGGYTGTIAEKSTFRMVSVPDGEKYSDYVMEFIQKRSDFDKDSPCGCICHYSYSDSQGSCGIYYFFGWASW